MNQSERITDAELDEVADMKAAVDFDAVITILRIARELVPKLVAEVKALRILAGKSKCVDCNSIAICTSASADKAHCTAWREVEPC